MLSCELVVFSEPKHLYIPPRENMRLLSTIPTTRPASLISNSPSHSTWALLQHRQCLPRGRHRFQFSTTSCLIPRQTILEDLPLPRFSQPQDSGFAGPQQRPQSRFPSINAIMTAPPAPAPAAASSSNISSDETFGSKASSRRPPPPPTHVLETALQVRDIAASTKFYKDILGVEPSLDTVSKQPSNPASHHSSSLQQRL
jgi:hypothetical protein